MLAIKKTKQPKNSNQMEKVFKGVSNYHRIDILLFVGNQKGVTLDDICSQLNLNFKTASGHTHRLVQSGLIKKVHQGRFVIHTLSPYGENIVKYIKSF
ncbi:MAG: helix-turn-helix transcriptional regulator [Candidatus Nomurabacteria bacterium]|nr:helix-turn-helix transcriptional regulator [Candidatus Nomurabacteria bacterium]